MSKEEINEFMAIKLDLFLKSSLPYLCQRIFLKNVFSVVEIGNYCYFTIDSQTYMKAVIKKNKIKRKTFILRKTTNVSLGQQWRLGGLVITVIY